ncbi:Metallo-beta-lactamase superfamily enzyme [Halapricum desulfuricans]|uniref:Metallo-beta-lactamase superfamily enzyme n=2 Tax=Halapricum desulfuricans TaxID=2841257 RepID=A0A897MZB6_9EURY|nr:Metallo-beta-lactamase superfamily enzyme [Halapricum desulfuricans]
MREIDRYDGGVGWMAHPDERMQRASHAVVGESGGVWVLDPVDADGLDGLLAEYGEVAGVAVLLDRHKRDAAAVARRHDVSVYVPEWMDGVAPKLDAPVERVRADLGGSGFEVHELIDTPLWQEAALYGEHDGTLVVPEALGTAEYFLASGESLGVHPALRLKPPRSLRRFAPERLLVGHGEGVLTDAARAIADALDGSRRRAPKLYAQTIQSMLFG